MENVTYTKDQLMAFTVKELKTLPLFSEIDPKGLSKEEIVDAMMKAQKEAIKASKEESKDETNSESNDDESQDEESNDDVEEDDNEEQKSETPHFHRPAKRGRSIMTFK